MMMFGNGTVTCKCVCPFDSTAKRKLFTGDNCEHNNTCGSADIGAHGLPCLNGGSPIGKNIDNCQCHCINGYHGDNCEKAPDCQ